MKRKNNHISVILAKVKRPCGARISSISTGSPIHRMRAGSRCGGDRSGMTRGRKNGFSTIEFLLYMGIFSILIVVLMQVFFTILDSQLSSESFSAVDQNGRYLLSKLQYDISQASSITTPASDGAQSSSLQITVNGLVYIYSLTSGGDLQLVNNGVTDVLTGYDASMSALTFKRVGLGTGNDTVQINFTLASRTVQHSQKAEIKSYQTTIGLRE